MAPRKMKEVPTEGVPLTDARKTIGETVKRVRPGQPVTLTRHGKAIAAVISPEDLKRLNAMNPESAMQDTITVMCFNHAGGAAKSSTTRDLGYELAQLGYRVLLIDLDPQANLTSWLGISGVSMDQTVASALMSGHPLPPPIEVHGLHVIPGHIDMSEIAEQLGAKTNGDGRLDLALQPVRESRLYDFVLIDPPPALGKLTTSGARAADFLIVPVPTSNKGLEALGGVRRMIREYTMHNPKLRIAFYLATQFTPTKHGKECLEIIRDELGDMVVGPLSFRPAVYNDCQAHGLPIGAYKPRDPAREEILQATKRLLALVGVAVPT